MHGQFPTPEGSQVGAATMAHTNVYLSQNEGLEPQIYNILYCIVKLH